MDTLSCLYRKRTHHTTPHTEHTMNDNALNLTVIDIPANAIQQRYAQKRADKVNAHPSTRCTKTPSKFYDEMKMTFAQKAYLN